MVQPLLELRGVNKSFGVVHVLHDVDFAVYPGQVTALVGDNGAGKSTLVKIIAGIYGRDSGDYFFDGKQVESTARATSPPSASRSSTRTSRSATTSTSSRTCSSAARRPSRFGLDEVTMETRARETLASLSVRTVKSVRQSVASLSGGQRQTVAIAKAVLWNSKVVLLDEPTAALGVAQTRQVLDLVRRLADRGLGVVLISHNMGDVFEVADRITALYLGRVAADVSAKDVTHSQIVELITAGRSGDLGIAENPATADRLRRTGDTTMTVDTDTQSAPAADRRRAASTTTTARPPPSATRPATTSTACAAATWAPCPPSSASSSCSSSSPRSTTGSSRPTTWPTWSSRPARSACMAMGIVFVLLLGEIDLSAGVAGGACATITALMLIDYDWTWWAATLAGVAVGAVIGLAIGSLVAFLGIPSFVVTLAFFLALQAVPLKLIGAGGSLRFNDPVLRGLSIKNVPVTAGWIAAILIVVGFAALSLWRYRSLSAKGLVHQPARPGRSSRSPSSP